MGQLSPILRNSENRGLTFWCPGCKEAHAINYGLGHPWDWNGNAEKPTFMPSILVKTGHHASHFNAYGCCWCTYDAEQIAEGKEVSGFACVICHSFVTDGQIHFLSDSTHELSGKIVDLPAWPTKEGE
jgi:hypothetical protein